MHETGRRRRLLPKPSIEDQSIASRRRKALAAVVLLSAAAATPARSGRPMRRRRVRRHSFNPNGTIRAAIQEPGLFAFYYPNLDVLNGGGLGGVVEIIGQVSLERFDWTSGPRQMVTPSGIRSPAPLSADQSWCAIHRRCALCPRVFRQHHAGRSPRASDALSTCSADPYARLEPSPGRVPRWCGL